MNPELNVIHCVSDEDGDNKTALHRTLTTSRTNDQFGRHFKQLFGEGDELFDRKTAMPFIHRFRERIGDTSAHSDQRSFLDAELGRDLVGSSEADAADVAGQAIRVLRDEPNGVGAVSFVDAYRRRCCAGTA
jgi:hypothetical protein